MYYLKIRKAESHCFRLWGASCHVLLSSSQWHQRRQQTLTAHVSRPAVPVLTCRPWTVHAILFQICRLSWVPLQGSPHSTKAFSLLASLNLRGEGQLGTPQLRNRRKGILPQSMRGSQGYRKQQTTVQPACLWCWEVWWSFRPADCLRGHRKIRGYCGRGHGRQFGHTK